MCQDRGSTGSIVEAVKRAHTCAVKHDFWTKPRNIGELICLIHSEASEDLEAVRHEPFNTIDVSNSKVEFHIMSEKPIGMPLFFEELADILIRVFDLVGATIDPSLFVEYLNRKMAYNETRPRLHNKSF